MSMQLKVNTDEDGHRAIQGHASSVEPSTRRRLRTRVRSLRRWSRYRYPRPTWRQTTASSEKNHQRNLSQTKDEIVRRKFDGKYREGFAASRRSLHPDLRASVELKKLISAKGALEDHPVVEASRAPSRT